MNPGDRITVQVRLAEQQLQIAIADFLQQRSEEMQYAVKQALENINLTCLIQQQVQQEFHKQVEKKISSAIYNVFDSWDFKDIVRDEALKYLKRISR